MSYHECSRSLKRLGAAFPCNWQAFTEVYYKLRDQILNDPLLAKQPAAARDWVREVSSGQRTEQRNN